MALVFVPTEPEHVLAIEGVSPASGFDMEWITLSFAVDAARTGALTAMDDVTGEVFGIAGFERQTNVREAECFAILGRTWRRHAKAITERVAEEIAKAPWPRLVLNVSTDDFPQGHAWAYRLGFDVEAPRMRGYWHDGRDMTRYAQYRPWIEG